METTRRAALGLLAASAALSGAPASAARPGPVRFDHGVASGDPLADRVIIWTRATPADQGVNGIALRWRIATSAEGRAVRSGRVEARAAADYTAKVDVRRLRRGTEYWYWFEAAGGIATPRGRFRTLPAGPTVDAVLAVASCQLHPGGLFNAWDAVARLDRVDAVVHLGDYIYEYGATGYGAQIGAKIGRIADPPHDIVTLADYRRRHAQYKADPDLQAAHARAAFICVWDDHETANDAFATGAENHDPRKQGDWAARKAAALQAYFEWMPIRDPAPGRPWEAINRSFAFGDLATLIMVETRLLARTLQVAFKGASVGQSDYATVLAEREEPARELLGEAQRGWIERELNASVAAGRRWQIIGNQVVMARVAGPDMERILGPERFPAMLARLSPPVAERVKGTLASFRAGVPFNLDAWDGYPAARERLYAGFRAARARPIILSGDSHAFWANDLRDSSGALVACEIGTTAITSPSWGDALPGLGLGAAIAAVNDEVVYCNQDAKGFALLTIERDRVVADLMTVSTITARPFTVDRVARFETRAEADGLTPLARLS